jgi:hypothetical protein
MRTDLVEEAQEIFFGIGGVKDVSVRSEEILCVDIVMEDGSEKARHAVYDAEWRLRSMFPDTWLRIHLD